MAQDVDQFTSLTPVVASTSQEDGTVDAPCETEGDEAMSRMKPEDCLSLEVQQQTIAVPTPEALKLESQPLYANNPVVLNYADLFLHDESPTLPHDNGSVVFAHNNQPPLFDENYDRLAYEEVIYPQPQEFAMTAMNPTADIDLPQAEEVPGGFYLM